MYQKDATDLLKEKDHNMRETGQTREGVLPKVYLDELSWKPTFSSEIHLRLNLDFKKCDIRCVTC